VEYCFVKTNDIKTWTEEEKRFCVSLIYSYAQTVEELEKDEFVYSNPTITVFLKTDFI